MKTLVSECIVNTIYFQSFNLYFQLLVALAFAAVVAEPEADAEAHYGLIGYGYSGYPGIYRYNYYGTRGYFGYPYRFGYYGRYWKREAEADAAPEADAAADAWYGYYGYRPYGYYGYRHGYYARPYGYYGRYWW